MCGRYTQLLSWDELVRLYGLTLGDGPAPNLRQRWNAAPTDPLPIVVRGDDGRRLVIARWGLIPPWAKELKGPPLINARSEGAATTPAFRAAFRARRCLVPTDGFYEWTAGGDGRKQPWRLCFEGRPMTLAGLWERHERFGLSFTILTAAAAGAAARLHDRMPVILEPEQFELWLGADVPQAAQALLQPYAKPDLVAFQVSPRVNSVRNDDAGLTERADGGAKQPDLFG